jgi:cullin 3
MENSGLITMLTNNAIDDLKKVYDLFGRVSTGHAELQKGIMAFIQSRGEGINSSLGGCGSTLERERERERPSTAASTLSTSSSSSSLSASSASATTTHTPQTSSVANPLKWIEAILDLKDQFDGLVETAFRKDKNVLNCVHAALEKVVNLNKRAPECLSLYVDEYLKKGVKAVS